MAIDPILHRSVTVPTDREFETLVDDHSAALRRAFAARYGTDVGNDVWRDALAWAWEHRDRLAAAGNPAGLLFRVGQTAARRYHRWGRPLPMPPEISTDGLVVEPGLHDALKRLRANQRVAVVLVHGYGYRYAEVAALLGVPVSTVRNHVHRAMARLRIDLEGT